MYRAPTFEVTEAILTTRPQPLSTMPATIDCVHRNVPVAFTAMTRFQSSSDWLWRGADLTTPALLTSTSTRPMRSIAALVSLVTLSGSVTSTGTGHACTPSARNSVATPSISFSLRAATTTAAPAAPSARAIAAPMPRPPPVTTAVFPSSVSRVFMRLASPCRHPWARNLSRGRAPIA